VTKYPQSPGACVAKMAHYMRTETTLSPRSIQFYSETAHAVIEILNRIKAESLPYKITEKDIRLLLDEMEDMGLARNTQKGYIAALRRITEFYDNNAIKRMNLRWPADSRPNADWLTLDQAKRLLALKKTPLQELGVHLELCLGLRRIEILRMKTEDIHDSYITVRGKGQMGGKLRNVPYHRDTINVLTAFNRYRQDLIEAARSRRPASTAVPEEYVIRLEGSVLRTYDPDGWGWDKTVIVPMREALGFQFSNHTLRRTFGRIMYRASVPVATIAQIYGHESTDVTLRYIGVDLDDMSAAMGLCPI